jgi:hypothetical protein
MAHYATRTQQIVNNVQEHQLLKFETKTARDNYCLNESATPIVAAQANKLMIADVWRAYRGAECVFHVARYIP